MLEDKLIQIAGVMDQVEAELLQQCGVKYLGFPLHLPVHREDLTEQQAAEIIQRLRPPVLGVLITYLSTMKFFATSAVGRDNVERLEDGTYRPKSEPKPENVLSPVDWLLENQP